MSHNRKKLYSEPPKARKLAAIYRKLGIEDRFCYKEHDGGHELDRGDGGIDFLCQHLKTISP